MTDSSADKEACRLVLAGPVTIASSQDLHQRLLRALDAGNDVEVECSDVTEADLSLVQLLLAARRSAEARRQRLVMRSAASGALLATLQRAGLVGAGPGADEGFWKGGMT